MVTTSLFNSHSASCSNEKHPLTFVFHSGIQHNVKVFLETDLFNDIIIFTSNNLPNLLLPDGVRKAWHLADISRCFSKSLCSTASRHSCCALNFESSGKESLWMILFKDYNCNDKRNMFLKTFYIVVTNLLDTLEAVWNLIHPITLPAQTTKEGVFALLVCFRLPKHN